MRWRVWLLLIVTACESRYGTYFHVDGSSNQIRFDRVQLYFGTPSQRTQIGTPNGPANGTVFDRDADPSDSFAVPPNADGSLATESEYWLPINDHNMQLGYVAAVAYDSTQTNITRPVGVGEVIGFKVEDGIVNKYEIELESPQGTADLWGPDPGCFAWTKQRDGKRSTIGVLLADDADCDGLVSGADCNDLCPPGSTSCSPDITICGSTATCGAGCLKAGNCQMEFCVPPMACSEVCAMIPTVESQLDCVAKRGGTDHVDILPDMQNGRPCVKSYSFMSYGRPCTSPSIVWQETLPDGWTFAGVTEGPTGYCTVTITPPSASGPSFNGDHHALIAFPAGGPLGHWSLLVGVQPGNQTTSNCISMNEQYHFGSAAPGSPFDCP